MLINLTDRNTIKLLCLHNSLMSMRLLGFRFTNTPAIYLIGGTFSGQKTKQTHAKPEKQPSIIMFT